MPGSVAPQPLDFPLPELHAAGVARGHHAEAELRQVRRVQLGVGQRRHRARQREVREYTALGYMHPLGRAIKIELNPDTPTAKTLLDVPMFDFHDQQVQVLPTPVDVGPGDRLRITCTHDATLCKRLPELQKSPPRYVIWANGSTDEMCSGTLSSSPKS
ncbi:hypothetical protein ACIQMJ_08485 [Actinosynnema sp. NPDC091369]